MKASDHDARFKAEAALQQRRYCVPSNCGATARSSVAANCAPAAATPSLPQACDRRVPREMQWQARQDILRATPRNIGAPERAARQCMPYDFYV